jgi:hypothetical protein
MHGRVVGEREGMHTLLGQALDFRRRRLHVEPRSHHQGNEAARCSVAPIVQMPVVVGLDGCERDTAVFVALKPLSRKTREGREADRTQNAIGIHVIDTGLDVPGAAAHLFVAQRLHAVFLFGAADHRVQAHVTRGFFLEHPDVATFVVLDAGLAPLVLRGHMAGECIGWLDGVIVNADEDEIFQFHLVSRG